MKYYECIAVYYTLSFSPKKSFFFVTVVVFFSLLDDLTTLTEGYSKFSVLPNCIPFSELSFASSVETSCLITLQVTISLSDTIF